MPEMDEEGVSRRGFLKMTAVGVGAAAVGGAAGFFVGQSRGPGGAAAPLQWWGIGTNDPEMGYENEEWSTLRDQVVFTEAPWDPVTLENKMGTDGKDIYDFISNAGTMHEPLFEIGAIVDFDPEETLPSWHRIYSGLRENNPTITISDTGQIVGVPIIQNGDSVAMNLDQLWGAGTETPGQGGDTYGLLFDDDWAGLTSMESAWACAIYKVANYLERNDLATISNLETLSNADLDTIKNFMLAEKAENQFATFWSGWNTAVSLMATEEVYAMDTWEPVVFALRAMEQPVNAFYMEPREGYYLWNIPLYMTPKGQRENLERSLNFFEWTLEGWYGARITTIRGYLTGTPDAINYAEVFPDAPGGPYDADFIEGRHEKVNAKFNDGVSVYGNQAPPNIEEYQAAWSEVTA